MNLLQTIAANRKLDGKLVYQGLPISIENAKGSVRQGVDKTTGKPWSVKMTYAYGYIRKTEGVDGDHVDCFIGPDPNASMVYVIHTVDPHTGVYDEDKCMLGFDSASSAKKALLENYSDPKFFGSMDAVPMASFKEKVFRTKIRPAKIAAAGWRLGTVLDLYAGGPGSGRHPEGNRIGQMDEKHWVSKDGTKTPVWKMNNGHLLNVLVQLHQQLYLARGEKPPGPASYLMNRANGPDGKIIERAIKPYRAMVNEAKKRNLKW